MSSLKGKTILITGASRGIGLAVGLRAALDGANIAILAKTAEPHPKLPGTIYTAAKDIEAVGGNALPIVCDIRFEEQVQAAVDKTVETFGGIDVCINNASAIAPADVVDTSMKKYDLMHQVNVRGTFLTSKCCIPHLTKADNPHILNMCPPIDLAPSVWAHKLAYWMSKSGMSLCVLGMSAELMRQGIAVNGLWPMGMVATAAIANVFGPDAMRASMKPEMLAEAAYRIITKPAPDFSGKIWIDKDLLASEGITDIDQYLLNPDTDLDENGQYTPTFAQQG